MSAQILLHGALTHADAHRLCREFGLRIEQDRRGHLFLNPLPADPGTREDRRGIISALPSAGGGPDKPEAA